MYVTKKPQPALRINSTPLVAKPHYPILDGLRGVAALMVVAFHVCEANAPIALSK